MSLRSNALACLALLALAGCGAAPPAAQPTVAPAATSSTAAPTATSPASVTYPLTLTDDRGSVTIPAPPQRVVTISEEMTELAVALGVQPVGFGSGRHEATQPGQPLAAPIYLDPALLGSPTFVGTLEPSIERLATLDPDLILYVNYDENIYQQLSQVAPTLGFEPSGNGAWQRIIGEVGKALGREQRAAEVVAEFEQRKAELRAQLAPAAARTPRITLLYLPAPDSTFVFNQNFAFGGMLTDLGFTLVVPEGVDPGTRGAVVISPEALAGLQTDLILTLQFSEGTQTDFPIEPIMASLDTPVLRTVLEQERPYTGPFSERFYLESFAALLLAAPAP
ncbi:MAG TPA: iron-siderophore ABC transporter substrate-binding protein [Roseiflexaceae bacterium]|nr:iron-siderophore ABC transporter substrate-binding protein [Roseiflexaceae bacterium]